MYISYILFFNNSVKMIHFDQLYVSCKSSSILSTMGYYVLFHFIWLERILDYLPATSKLCDASTLKLPPCLYLERSISFRAILNLQVVMGLLENILQLVRILFCAIKHTMIYCRMDQETIPLEMMQ